MTTLTKKILCVSSQKIKAIGKEVRERQIGHIQCNACLSPVMDAPQQRPGSLDCGVIMLHIIRQYFRQQPIHRVSAEDGNTMRRGIAETF